MKIETIPVGYLETNCYIITKNEKTIIIDPGDELEKIMDHLKGKTVVGILITHHHFDHIGALQELEKKYHLKHNNQIEEFDYKIIENPGHSKDSISFYFEEENIMFSGDFVFYHAIGRCDLEGGNFKEMQTSIKKLLKEFKDVKIYPGHGLPTTLKEEIPYLNYYIEKN